ncbi:hypothetical protein DB88DRAFT_98009 [Papiliotrema laurentii]|uniref:Kinetochore protein Spc24 n=1 Tax=Papiliotrema laurentii TaxID=5418 RepID=A0AAD9CVK7_PAPLA|nr:hypothetical protein DB88DRAFT_98009 [Papiliotrema laurentii]
MATMYAPQYAPNLIDTSEEYGYKADIVEGDDEYLEADRTVEVSEEQWRAMTKILQDVRPTLLPDEELGDLAAAEAAVQEKIVERNVIIDQLQEDLRQLTRQHAQAVQAAQRPPTHPSLQEHDAQVRTLESKQHHLGKALNEEQVGMTKREGELQRAKGEKEEVEAEEVGDDDWVDGKALRLKLLADAGFTFVPPKDDKTGAKVLIRAWSVPTIQTLLTPGNDVKEDVHTVSVDKNKSRVHQANLMWSLASD